MKENGKYKEPLTQEERKEISKKILDYAKKNPKFKRRVNEVVWKASKRHMTDYN